MRGRSEPSEHEAGPAKRLGHRTRVARHDGDSVGERLDQRGAEALMHGHREEDVGAAVPRVAGLIRDRPSEDDPTGSDPRNEYVERPTVALESKLRADDDERRIWRAVTLVERESLDGVLEPLVRDDPADRQHERLSTRVPARHFRRQPEEKRYDDGLPQPRIAQVCGVKPRIGNERGNPSSKEWELGSPTVAQLGEAWVEFPQEFARRYVVVAERHRPSSPSG